MTEPAPRTHFIDLSFQRLVAATHEYVELRGQVDLLRRDVAFRAKHIQLMKKFLEESAREKRKK